MENFFGDKKIIEYLSPHSNNMRLTKGIRSQLNLPEDFHSTAVNVWLSLSHWCTVHRKHIYSIYSTFIFPLHYFTSVFVCSLVFR